MTKAGGKGEAFDPVVSSEDGEIDEPRRLAEGQVQGYQTQLADAKTVVGAIEAKIDKLRDLLAGAEAGLADAKAEIPRLETEVASAESELENI